jgi:hypothetical protein
LPEAGFRTYAESRRRPRRWQRHLLTAR